MKLGPALQAHQEEEDAGAGGGLYPSIVFS